MFPQTYTGMQSQFYSLTDVGAVLVGRRCVSVLASFAAWVWLQVLVPCLIRWHPGHFYRRVMLSAWVELNIYLQSSSWCQSSCSEMIQSLRITWFLSPLELWWWQLDNFFSLPVSLSLVKPMRHYTVFLSEDSSDDEFQQEEDPVSGFSENFFFSAPFEWSILYSSIVLIQPSNSGFCIGQGACSHTWNFGNAPAGSAQCFIYVQHFSCLFVLVSSGMQKHRSAWTTMQQCTAYGFTSTQALWDIILPFVLSSNVLLVFLSKPIVILPHAVLALLFGLSCEPCFSAVIGFS